MEVVTFAPLPVLIESLRLGLADLFGEYQIWAASVFTAVQVPPSLSVTLVQPGVVVVITRRFPVAGSCSDQVVGGASLVKWMILSTWIPAGAAVPAEAALRATVTPLKPSTVSAVAVIPGLIGAAAVWTKYCVA